MTLEPWQKIIKQAINTPAQLCAFLELEAHQLAPMLQGHELFKILVPWSYAQKIKKKSLDDPLLLQILPQAQEAMTVPGFDQDPLQEATCAPVKGVLHKYHGRVLKSFYLVVIP